MLHARSDYDRIQDPAGLIPQDEPVMIFRAQDSVAWLAVAYYADMLEAAGGDMEMVRICREHAKRMRYWPVKKLPDLPT
jgi:hypothetical protein